MPRTIRAFIAIFLICCAIDPFIDRCMAMTKDEAKKAYQGLSCEITSFNEFGYPTCAKCNDLTALVSYYDKSWDIIPELTSIVLDINFSTPNNGQKWDGITGPTTEYQISNFKPGQYVFSVYGTKLPDPSSDSVHYGIDGVLVGTITLDANVSPAPKWSSKLQGGGTANITISDNSIHKINFWAREDGAEISKIRIGN